MMKHILTILFLFTIWTYANAQDEEKHPIDIKLEQCHAIDSNQTTYGMMQCEATAREEWDKELNKYYKLLMSKLSPEEQEKLKAAQRKWLEYRDAEFDFSSTMHYNMDGTMWRVVAAGRSKDIVRQRALELKDYYETITFDQ